MKLLCRTLIALAGLLSAGVTCRAQDHGLVWSEWEAAAEDRHGPAQAGGLLLYFHDESPDAFETAIPFLFAEMARIARWDILRINRRPPADLESEDDTILRFTAERVALARRDGYRQVIVAGFSRGGWLALSAATLRDVDAVIGLAPGTTNPERPEPERTRDALARKLAGARTRRVAAFFFEGDPREGTERRAIVVRRALQESGASFMVVDRPPDLPGRESAMGGRFFRRYRDCLLQFARDAEAAAGEVPCSRSSGYAVGSDIGFPVSVRAPRLPAYANPAYAPFWGRWEGDDDLGGYLIMEAVAVGAKGIVFRMGYADPSSTRLPRLGFSGDPRGRTFGRTVQEARFRLDEPHGRIYLKGFYRHDLILMKPRSSTELDCVLQLSDATHIERFGWLLHKRGNETDSQ